MSSTAMWLLLAVVVVVILFASVLYKRTFTPHELALTGVMAALSFAAYLFFRVPFYGGASVPLGNTFPPLAALLVGGGSGGPARALRVGPAALPGRGPGHPPPPPNRSSPPPRNRRPPPRHPPLPIPLLHR